MAAIYVSRLDGRAGGVAIAVFAVGNALLGGCALANAPARDLEPRA